MYKPSLFYSRTAEEKADRFLFWKREDKAFFASGAYFNGWTLEEELLKVTQEEYTKAFPEWSFKRIVIKDSMEEFCNKNNHRLPSQYAYLPWERVYNYIHQFSIIPPNS